MGPQRVMLTTPLMPRFVHEVARNFADISLVTLSPGHNNGLHEALLKATLKSFTEFFSANKQPGPVQFNDQQVIELDLSSHHDHTTGFAKTIAI